MIKKILFVWLVLVFVLWKNNFVVATEDIGITTDNMIPFYSGGNGKVIEPTPFYIAEATGLKKMGTLESGLVLTPTTISDIFFTVEVGNIQYNIPKFAMKSTNEKPTLELPFDSTGNSSILTAKRDAQVRSESGDVVATIEIGNDVTLHSVEENLGVIQLFGKKMFIDLADFRHINLVNPKKNISYNEMEYILQVISLLYPDFTELMKIGTSVQGRNLYALKIGKGDLEILMDASMHGREHMTTNVLLEMMDEYIKAYDESSKIGEFDVKELLNKVSIWFVPMMNPDGVTLVQTGLSVLPEQIIMNYGSVNFNRWKANIHGVDLNRNFDGGWVTKKTVKFPAYKDYKGEGPFTEPEARALRDFIAQRIIKSYITYHSSGSVIYYYHHQVGEQLKRDLTLAKKLSKVTGYRIMKPTGDTGSGASADWFIMTYKLPGITMEIAPHIKESFVPLKYWDDIWNKNKLVGLVVAEEVLTW
ncbi:M14 family zinc carboxypeptidase [Ureibacillus manganicus]|uniref:M14 family zinc carboxypeptidase n=1 Tax=Ureibacillus manganicus TaxID=1266064 RepID=UPI0006905CAF|nr:M14 family zinc carboxypeptidase [Ureibacillus manganicus]